jgi:hypothetical protein
MSESLLIHVWVPCGNDTGLLLPALLRSPHIAPGLASWVPHSDSFTFCHGLQSEKESRVCQQTPTHFGCTCSCTKFVAWVCTMWIPAMSPNLQKHLPSWYAQFIGRCTVVVSPEPCLVDFRHINTVNLRWPTKIKNQVGDDWHTLILLATSKHTPCHLQNRIEAQKLVLVDWFGLGQLIRCWSFAKPSPPCSMVLTGCCTFLARKNSGTPFGAWTGDYLQKQELHSLSSKRHICLFCTLEHIVTHNCSGHCQGLVCVAVNQFHSDTPPICSSQDGYLRKHAATKSAT